MRVSIVRAIRAGEWTNELSDWADDSLTVIGLDDEDDDAHQLRAVQTAEAFTVLLLGLGRKKDIPQFLKDCGY